MKGAGGKQQKYFHCRKRAKEHKARVAKFTRGEGIATRYIKDRKLKGQLRHSESLAAEAATSAAQAEEWLLPEVAGALEAEGMERTWRFGQEDLVREVEVGAAAKAFDLSLPDLGPYNLDFTRSGRYMLLGGRKGHLGILDWQRAHLVTELQASAFSFQQPLSLGLRHETWVRAGICQLWPCCR